MLLGCDDIDADTAELWGLVNRALADAELDAFVDRLARDIAAHPAAAVRYAKLAVNQATAEPPALAVEAALLDDLKASTEARHRLGAFLEAGGQTAGGEAAFRALLEATRARSGTREQVR
jgi:enoyl-CoA hydratase/carnithine racemase